MTDNMEFRNDGKKDLYQYFTLHHIVLPASYKANSKTNRLFPCDIPNSPF